MKGIILAGGSGSRMYPITLPTIKQLLPVYDKPMIYYPLSTLMVAGVDDILLISTPNDLSRYEHLFGDGSDLGISFSYAVQKEPKGLAEAFIIGEDFIGKENIWMILGDNIIYGVGLESSLTNVSERKKGATVFAYKVEDPEKYGVIEFDERGKPKTIVEKPKKPKSRYAQIGLYHFDSRVSEIAKKQEYSDRGELEIVDTVKQYLDIGQLNVEKLGTGCTWLDAGSFDSLCNASNFVKVIRSRQGIVISSPEEVAYRKGWINKNQLKKLGDRCAKTSYGQYLINLSKE